MRKLNPNQQANPLISSGLSSCRGDERALDDMDDCLLGEIIKQRPEITYNNNRTYPNGKKAPDGIEIRFGSARPTEDVREMLKANGFRFSEKQVIWYALSNVKSREFAQKLSEMEVDVDTTQYEKLSFWAKVKNSNQYKILRDRTNFFVKTDPPKYFYSKQFLQRAFPSYQSFINNQQLYFKKYYNKVVGEDETEENESKDTGGENTVVADKLKALGDAMQKQIDQKLNPAISNQRPTARRMRIASSMRDDGYRLQNVQDILYALSQAHRNGSINDYSYLKNIRTRSQIEILSYYANAIKHEWSKENIQRSLDSNRSSLQPLGINTMIDWGFADGQKTELLEKFSPSTSQQQNKNEKRIKELELEIISRKIPGFFPTPRPLIDRLLDLADLHTEQTILEPSAGKGDILDSIKDRFPGSSLKLYAAEINSTLREILTLKEYELIGTDFLEVDTKFDRIIMNPPFENGQDADHVTHALDLLKHGGRVVAIMGEGVFFRQFKKDTAFRELLKKKNAYISEPIEAGFKNAFNSTGVRVRMVAINENGSPVEFDTNREETSSEESEDTKLLELEAEAELELLKMRVERKRTGKKTTDGLGNVDPEKLQRFRHKAWQMQNDIEVLNFK